jgi:very-short-patch-repair endonuclease
MDLDLSPLFAAHFGVVRTKLLIDLGLSNGDIRRLARAGQLVQVRQGWWATPNANANVMAAVKARGVLTGPAALELRGAWVPKACGIAVRLTERRMVDRRVKVNDHVSANRVWAPEGCASLHVLEGDLVERCTNSCDDVSTALLVTMRDLGRDVAVVLADSVVERKLLTSAEVEAIANKAGARGEAVLELHDPSAGSGIESLFRLWLRRHRIAFQTQRWIEGVGRVDFLIGERLIVEVDGRQFHDTDDQCERDRARDREAVARGYLVIRLTYNDVVERLDAAGEQILRVIRRNDHTLKPKG